VFNGRSHDVNVLDELDRSIDHYHSAAILTQEHPTNC
jgi:hypothetical protein